MGGPVIKKFALGCLAQALLLFPLAKPCLADDSEKMETAKAVLEATESVGLPFSQGGAGFINLAEKQGMLYVAFQDQANGNKVTVKRHRAGLGPVGDWQALGKEGFSQGRADYVHFAFNGETPYVAFLDAADPKNETIEVMKFNGKNWEEVGKTGIGITPDFDFACSKGTPYLAFAKYGTGGQMILFDGKDWVPAFNGTFHSGVLAHLSLAFSPTDNIPTLAFSDYATGYRLTVEEYLQGKWMVIDHEGLSNGNASGNRLVFDKDMPYVAFNDYDTTKQDGNGEDKVLGLDGDKMAFGVLNWMEIGNPLPTMSGGAALAFRSGQAFLAYVDRNSVKTQVVKFEGGTGANGGNWASLDQMGFSRGGVMDPSLIYDEKKDLFFLAYSDEMEQLKGKVVWIDPKTQQPLNGSR
jgi:hypothetical protein